MRHQQRQQRGVMMIEVLLGILIFSIGILAMLGMQTTAMRATIDAKYRAEAGFLANEILGVMWGDPANIANYASANCASTARCNAWLTKVGNVLPGGLAPVITVNGRQVQVAVLWQGPGATSASNHTVLAQIVRASD